MNLFCIQQNIFAQDTLSVVKEGKQKQKTSVVKKARKQDQNSLSIEKAWEQKLDTMSFAETGNQESDTLSLVKSARQKFLPETMRATMMAVALPGLGQIYNRKYWKIPVVYAGFGALIYFIKFNSSQYNKYVEAYQDFTDDIKETDSYIKLIHADRSTYDPWYPGYSQSMASLYKENMLRMVDYHKQYRDLSYIGIAGWYLLSILDANVDASLFNYDVSPNLDISFIPTELYLPGGVMYAGINVSVKITF